jgi:hypothetical protein
MARNKARQIKGFLVVNADLLFPGTGMVDDKFGSKGVHRISFLVSILSIIMVF